MIQKPNLVQVTQTVQESGLRLDAQQLKSIGGSLRYLSISFEKGTRCWEKTRGPLYLCLHFINKFFKTEPVVCVFGVYIMSSKQISSNAENKNFRSKTLGAASTITTRGTRTPSWATIPSTLTSSSRQDSAGTVRILTFSRICCHFL